MLLTETGLGNSVKLREPEHLCPLGLRVGIGVGVLVGVGAAIAPGIGVGVEVGAGTIVVEQSTICLHTKLGVEMAVGAVVGIGVAVGAMVGVGVGKGLQKEPKLSISSQESPAQHGFKESQDWPFGLQAEGVGVGVLVGAVVGVGVGVGQELPDISHPAVRSQLRNPEEQLLHCPCQHHLLVLEHPSGFVL